MNIRLLILMLLFSYNSAAEEQQSIDEFLIQSNTQGFCENSKYINCMRVTEDSCVRSFKNAINLCMEEKPIEKLMPSAVCITNNYVKNINVDDKTLKSCEYVAAEIAAEAKAKYMPNKSLKNGTREERRAP